MCNDSSITLAGRGAADERICGKPQQSQTWLLFLEHATRTVAGSSCWGVDLAVLPDRTVPDWATEGDAGIAPSGPGDEENCPTHSEWIQLLMKIHRGSPSALISPYRSDIPRHYQRGANHSYYDNARYYGAIETYRERIRAGQLRLSPAQST